MNWQNLKAKDYSMDFFQVLLVSLSRHEGCWIIPGGKMKNKDQAPPEFSAMREALNSGWAWSLGSIFPPGIIQQTSCLDNEINSTWKKKKPEWSTKHYKGKTIHFFSFPKYFNSNTTRQRCLCHKLSTNIRRLRGPKALTKYKRPEMKRDARQK